MKQWLKKYAGILYILLATAAILVIMLSGGNLPGVLHTLGALRVRWVWAAAGLLLLYVFSRAVTLHVYLRGQNCRIAFYQSLIVSGIGQFYSAVTPSSSGGQPMQVLSLSRFGVPVSVGTAAVSIKFIGFQSSFILLGALLWFSHRGLVAEQLGPVRYLVLLGFAINAALLFAIVLVMVNKRVVRSLLNAFVNLAARLRLLRDREGVLQKAEHMLDDYQRALYTLGHRPLFAASLFLLCLAQVLFYMGIIVCVYHAFSLTGASAGALLTLQVLLFITAAFVPLPGAAGAQEGGFYLFFRGVFPESDLLAAVVCWRFFTYYLLLLIGLLGVVGEGVAHYAAGRKKDAQR